MLDVGKDGSCFHSYLITVPTFFFFAKAYPRY